MLFYGSKGLTQWQINSVKAELKQNYSVLFPVNPKLLEMLGQPEHAEFACLIYLLQKSYWQPALSYGLLQEPAQQQLLAVFEELPAFILSLKKIRKDFFTCQLATRPPEELLKRVYNFRLNPHLEEIQQSIKEVADAKRKRLFWLTVGPVLLLFSVLLFWICFKKKQSEEESKRDINILIALAIALVSFPVLWVYILQRLYPDVVPILQWHILLNNKVMNRYAEPTGRILDGKKLMHSGEYVDFFQKFPHDEPQTLYELAHKLFSLYYIPAGEKIPVEIVEDELIKFLNSCRYEDEVTLLEEGRPPFPVQEFLSLIVYTAAFATMVEWGVDSQVKREEKVKQIVSRSNFYSPKRAEDIETSLLVKKNL